jgi:NADP-dependent 3-hydroxy acid dehydrogenase YdfG
MAQLHEDEWAQEVSVNCMGVLNCIGAVLHGMLERKSGHIINMCDSIRCRAVVCARSQTHVAAHQTQADAPSPASQCICAAACIATQALTGVFRYSGTKFFVEGLSQGLRKECAGSGVKVTCIQPGDTHSGIPACTTDEAARAEFAQSSQDRNLWLDASDVAAAVVWALSQPSHVAVNEVLVEPVQAPA